MQTREESKLSLLDLSELLSYSLTWNQITNLVS